MRTKHRTQDSHNIRLWGLYLFIIERRDGGEKPVRAGIDCRDLTRYVKSRNESGGPVKKSGSVNLLGKDLTYTQALPMSRRYAYYVHLDDLAASRR